MLLRAQRIRQRVGGSPNMLEDFPPKPKGMHWRTYERKVAEWMAAERRADEAWLLASAPLFRRLGIV